MIGARDRKLAPGKVTAVDGYGSVQGVPGKQSGTQQLSEGPNGPYGVQAIADAGVGGHGQQLPHLAAIQRSFGPDHDVAGIRAHVGGDAAEAAHLIGAEAYATGNDVAFAQSPDLHTAAHEATHIVQQRHGVQLRGGVGETGDAYEREADQVADAVVAGKSAAPLLDRYQPNVGTRAVQRRSIIQSQNKEASIELQRVLESDNVALVEGAYKALRNALPIRGEQQVTDIVTFGAGEDSYWLAVAVTTTNRMIPAFRTRRDQLKASTIDDPAWLAFAEKFNAHFKPVLNAFDLGPDPANAERKDVMAARLQFLFTKLQREKLMSYFATKTIPERLFNGDDVGAATAQQRILLAGHILANGNYEPGSEVQEVHARACYHWAQIVYHYAGATGSGLNNKGVLGSFDHAGDVVLGKGKGKDVVPAIPDPSLPIPAGTDHAAADAKGKAPVRFQTASWDKVLAVQPGDWLYVYNANTYGAHSVIFAGWAGEVQHHEGKPYRPALTYHQGDPDVGGSSKVHHLGDDFFKVPDGPRVVPVNRIYRVNPEASPAQALDELSPKLTAGLQAKNKSFVKELNRKLGKHGTQELSLPKLHAWLRETSAKHIETLGANRLSKHQREMFEGGLAREEGQPDPAYDHQVVCLYQRVAALAHNSNILETNQTAQQEAHDAERDAADAAREARRNELLAEIDGYYERYDELQAKAEPLRDQLEQLDVSEALDGLRKQHRSVSKQLRKLDKRKKDERQALEGVLAALDVIIDSMEAAENKHAKKVRELRKQLKPIDREANALGKKADKRFDEVDKLGGDSLLKPEIVAGGKTKGQLLQTVDGRYDNLPLVPWQSFMVDKPKPTPP